MKPIIFRKPKFMRNDFAMYTYIKIACAISECACSADTVDREAKLMRKAGICLREAAKAGGFFGTKDFLRWMEAQKNN